jgi:hypothetical protein
LNTAGMTGTDADDSELGPSAPRASEDAPEFLAACNLALSAERVLNLSRAFAEVGRPIDLSGLDLWIGRLTAAVLDLDVADGRRLRPALLALLASLDRLEAAVRQAASAHGVS